jgi:hypothetical protein
MVDRGAWEHVGEFLGGGGVATVGKENMSEAEGSRAQQSSKRCGVSSQRWEGINREVDGKSSSKDENVV